MPPFNVVFMDDKHYPYIAISKDGYPRLTIKRDVKNKKYKYYGPFPDSKATFNVINILNRVYPFVKCNKIPKTSCLYYHMGQCLAPCVNKIDVSAFDIYKKEVDKFFKGQSDELLKDFSVEGTMREVKDHYIEDHDRKMSKIKEKIDSRNA